MEQKLATVLTGVKWILIFSCLYLAQLVSPLLAAEQRAGSSKIKLESQTSANLTPARGRVSSLTITPTPPDFPVTAFILLDANSGAILAAKNAKTRVAPASLTKLMTLYLAAAALQEGRLHLTDPLPVSEAAWRTKGSRMFIQVGSTVTVGELIQGIVVASGNDATVALAEHLGGGSEQNFVGAMNQMAQKLQLLDTNYVDSNGFNDDGNYSTAFDLAKLAQAWLWHFPEYYPWFKEKWITYQGIKQPNRNRLLWRNPAVDGIKTGHTNSAGYCLVASASRDAMRLIVVLMGAKSDAARTSYAEALLNYGFRFFETHKLFAANQSLVTPRVLLGKEKTVALGLKEALYVTIPSGQAKDLKVKATLHGRLQAPIVQNQAYGTLTVYLQNKVLAIRPLLALQANARVNFIWGIVDYLRMLFQK